MRILFINKFNWQEANPMATISTLSTWSLAKTGIPVTLLIQDVKEGEPNTILQQKFGLKPLENYHIRLFRRKNSVFGKNAAFYRFIHQVVAEELAKTDRLLIITRNTNLLPRLSRYANRKEITLLFESHGYHGSHNLPGLPDRPSVKLMSSSFQYGWTERLYLKKFHGMICITSPQELLYKADGYKLPTIVLPLGSPEVEDATKFRNPQDQFTSRLLVYTGRFTHHLNVPVILDALVKTADTGIRFAWLGLKPNDFPHLEKLVQTAGLSDRIDLMPWMSHADMRNFLAEKASVGLAAYTLSFRSAAVTSPSKIFDYYSCGLPVIAPEMPTITEVLKSGVNGFTYQPDNSESLAAAIRKVFQSSTDFVKLRDGALNAAEQFSWESRSRKLLNFAEKVSQPADHP